MYEIFKEGVRKCHGDEPALTTQEIKMFHKAGYEVRINGKAVKMIAKKAK
jgi:hypothetical protein